MASYSCFFASSKTRSDIRLRTFFQWCRKNISGIEFKFVSSTQIRQHSQAISDRLGTGRTIPGTRSHHKFMPTSDGLKMFRLSADELSTTVSRENPLLR